jgi:hypothetical protein
MSHLRNTLNEAVRTGLVSSDQGAKLEKLFASAGHITSQATGSVFAANPGKSFYHETSSAVESSESPRLVRGFHDILVTIGVFTALGGLLGLAGGVPTLIAIIVLAEILVRRQNLALPAFVLTLAIILVVAKIALPIAKDFFTAGDRPPGPLFFFFFLVPCVTLTPFYWRYRIPVALAILIFSLLATASIIIMMLLESISGFNVWQQKTFLIMGLFFSFVLFSIGLRFDISDPMRNTRRSDIGFWLHLATAPILLFFTFSVLFPVENANLWLAIDASLSNALIAMAVVALFMLIGIIIDRRAFVTSGLVSLGAAIYVVARESQIDINELSFLPVLGVGIVVLSLGISWQRLRGRLIKLLPQAIQKRVPPVHQIQSV